MAAKKQTPPPIDRPLSKAYVRQFTGWSSAYPPGMSDPNSLYAVSNMMTLRDGSLITRPGLRLLTYTECPGLDLVDHDSPGTAEGLPVIGGVEPFYTASGEKALLYTVLPPAGPLEFRAVLLSGTTRTVHRITDPEIGFRVRGTAPLGFSRKTRRITYLQIDNKILALSDTNEPARLFDAGSRMTAMVLTGCSVPRWEVGDKLQVFHPDAAWISGGTYGAVQNSILNPSFALGTAFWTAGDATHVEPLRDSDPDTRHYIRLRSKPARRNLVPAPLHDPGATGTDGWSSDAVLSVSGGMLTVDLPNRGTATVEGPRIIGLENAAYRLSLLVDSTPDCDVSAEVEFRTCNGAPIPPALPVAIGSSSGRFTSNALVPPTGAVSATLRVTGTGTGRFRFSEVQFNLAEEDPGFFGPGSPDFHWTGTPNASPSVIHPVREASIRTDLQPAWTGQVDYSILHRSSAGSPTVKLGLLQEKPDGTVAAGTETSAVSGSAWSRTSGASTPPADTSKLSLQIRTDLGFDQYLDIDRAKLTRFPPAQRISDPSYWDGSTAPTTAYTYHWLGAPHASVSERRTHPATDTMVAETPTVDTLVSSDATKNTYHIGAFYTFENETGETAPSRITEVKVQRPWSSWLMKEPDAAGKPTTATEDPDRAADQLIMRIPSDVYAQAVKEGALRWNLYVFAWSDQDPVPVVGQLVQSVEMRTDESYLEAAPWAVAGWTRITPVRIATSTDMMLPSEDRRDNATLPPRHMNGIVAGDRLILVGDPDDLATITWTSNRPGEYLNFSSNRGGGVKTLSSGSINTPVSVTVWQNPQSVDTITVLCQEMDGTSSAYYMNPATVNSGSSGTITVLGFEEITNTSGTSSPWGAIIVNNALYRSLSQAFVKSTAANYNINHKSMTDQIANMWQLLMSREYMQVQVLNNRIGILVHNPLGKPLEEYCSGNEIWILDVGSEKPSWTRFEIQASAIRTITVGPRTYLGVCGPTGIHYLDEFLMMDEGLDNENHVVQKQIPWHAVTNVMGANRAHDAWAHLQQLGVLLGDTVGSVRYGIHGLDAHGKRVDVSKVYRKASAPAPRPGERQDVEDYLQVRRDMKEWQFYIASEKDEPGATLLSYVQFRYTPVSVNIGYEFGSVETFEYGSPPDARQEQGIPRPYIDYGRP